MNNTLQHEPVATSDIACIVISKYLLLYTSNQSHNSLLVHYNIYYRFKHQGFRAIVNLLLLNPYDTGDMQSRLYLVPES